MQMNKDVVSLVCLGSLCAVSVTLMMVSFLFASWISVAVSMMIAVVSVVAFFKQVCDMEEDN